MTEEEVGRQAEVEKEPVAPPTPTVASVESPAVGSAEPSFDAGALVDEMLEKLAPMLDNKIDARFKSAKDKRFAKVEEILTAVKEAGGDPEKVRGRLEQADLYDRLDKIEAGISSGGAIGIAPEPDIQSDTAEILQKAGISFDDPDVASWASKSFTSEAQALTGLRAVVTKRAKQGNVTPAATVGSSGGAPPSGDAEYDAVVAQMDEYTQGKHGSLGNKETFQKYQELAKKANELSPPVTDYDKSGYLEP